MIEGEVEVLEIGALPQEGVTGSSRAPASTRVRRASQHLGRLRRSGGESDRCRDRADGGEPDVLLEAGQIEPGDADGDRDGGSASQMETR
jgi:hypothetical protein